MAQFVRPLGVTKENKCLKCQIVGEGGLRGDGEGEQSSEKLVQI